MKIFNTLTRKLETFKPLKDKQVRMYTCGPTVYDYPHIGNYRAYVFSDVLRRYLKWKGLKVKGVMNITDVDDKTIHNSGKEGLKLKEFTQKYEKSFFEDLEKLNIEIVEAYPRATDNIDEMVKLIKKLMKKGLAYRGSDGSIYFSISKFGDYGKLAHINLSELKAGASGRVDSDNYTKDQLQDFAVWKAWTQDDGDVFWETDIGKGRPGWHIECSAMSMKYLGQTFDLHIGGVDLIFPHHQNEIAQSEGATGKKFVNYWVHNEHLMVDSKKMSKSLGNFYTLRDILKESHNPAAVRYVLLASHYRQQLNFTMNELRGAENTVRKLWDFMDRLNLQKKFGKFNTILSKATKKAKNDFVNAMENDLNTPEALVSIFELVKVTNSAMESGRLNKKNVTEIRKLLESFDKVLGILKHEHGKIPMEVIRLVSMREAARKEGDFGSADKIRREIIGKGWVLEDTPQGPRIKKK